MKNKYSIFLIATIVCLMFAFVGCSTTAEQNQNSTSSTTSSSTSSAQEKMLANINADKELAQDISYTFVGSYQTINTMGVVRASHIINLFKDGSLEIYMGFFNDGMGGSLQECYTGTYTIVGETLTLNYLSLGNSEEERELVATLENGQFSGKIWIGASYSTYDMTYYSIETKSVANANEVFVGSVFNEQDNSYTASLLTLYHGAEGSYVEDEGVCILTIKTNTTSQTTEGEFEKLWAGLEDDDMLQFTFDIEQLVNYSNSYVITTEFEISSETYSNTLVRVK